MMPAYPRGERYTRVAILLHWVIAALILFNLALGYFMEGFSPPWRMLVVSVHVSSGITVLALTVIRVLWRLTHEPPAYDPHVKPWERHLAHLVHFLLYVGMVLMPVIGWGIISAHPPQGSAGAAYEAAHPTPRPGQPPIAQSLPPVAPPGAGPMSTAGSTNAPPRGSLKLWWVIPLPQLAPISEIGSMPGGLEPQKALHERFVVWHGLGGYIMILLLILHVAGAMKHQLIDKQEELARMGVGKRRC